MNDKLIRIWIVDDNQGDLYLFHEAFRHAGLNADILAIGDGAEALALIGIEETSRSGSVPDLVLLDLNLPKADGIEVLESMRRGKVFSNVPVVITSSIISPNERARAEHLRVARYFTKPFDLEAFFQIAIVLKEELLANNGLQSKTGGTIPLAR